MSKKNKVFNLIKKIVWGIIWAIFAVVFFITSWLFVDKFICKSPVPSFLGYSSLTIETGSMSGTMEIGDMIIIKNTGDYKIGDIFVFILCKIGVFVKHFNKLFNIYGRYPQVLCDFIYCFCRILYAVANILYKSCSVPLSAYVR